MPLTRQEALDRFHSPDLIGLGFEADAVRRRLHPEGVVTYIIDRNINYTNFCTEYCTFCAFYRPLKGARSEEGYILEFEKICEKIAETQEMGGTGVLMQGGIHPDLKIDWFEKLFSGIKQRFPKIWLHCLTASEILALAKYSDLTLRDTIVRLRDAVAHFVVQDLRAAAGDGVEAGIAQANDGVAQIQVAVFGDGQNFRRGEAMEPDPGEALLDAREEPLEPFDFEVRVDAALHQHAGTAHLLGLCDFLADGLEVEDVAFLRARAFERPVESAKGAVLSAEVGVVDVAIDDVGDYAFGVEAAAHGIRFKAQADEVGGVEMVKSLLACQRHRFNFNNSVSEGRAGCYLRDGLRKRNRPLLRTGRPCVRERFDAVETPLNRTKKSQKACQMLFFLLVIEVGPSRIDPVDGHFVRSSD